MQEQKKIKILSREQVRHDRVFYPNIIRTDN